MKRATFPAPDSLAAALLAASEAVAEVIGGRSIDAALASTAIDPARRGAVQDLAYGALRQYARGDFLMARLMRQPLREVRLRTLLLAAFHRLEARPGDAHTTVDQAVAAAATLAGGRFKGLVNAVLRSYLRRREELEGCVAANEEARWRMPSWWIAALRRAYADDWREILAAGNAHPPMTLRVNRRRSDAAAYVERLAAAAIAARPLGGQAVLLERPQPVATLPGFAEGWASVQDWGAQQAAALLDIGDGMRVLDTCAAPGGKTAHLLESAELDLLALEVDERRAGRIRENLERLGLDANIMVGDCRDLARWWDGRPFERILADVPCSASGVVRRHPDGRWLRRAADVAGFALVQAEIIEAVWRTLAPDGKMLYCTCSLFPEENGAQVAAFAARHRDAQRLPIGSGEELQLTPQADHDGFYYALLQKRA